MSKQCYYSILEINKESSEEEIKKAYRRQASKFHPDKNPNNPESEEKFKLINEAYETLKDPEKRASYDRFGHSSSRRRPQGFNPFDMFSQEFGFAGDFGPFSQFFRGANHNNQQSSSSNGETVQHNIQITLEESFRGTEKEFTFPSYDLCNHCNGNGIKATNGSSNWRCQTCGGQGKVGIRNGPFQIIQECHSCGGSCVDPSFKCDTCGGQGRVRGHKTVKVTLPKGIENNATLRMRGAGYAGIRGGEFGDLFLTVRIPQDALFKRDGLNLVYEHEVPFYDCLLGCNVTLNRFGEPIQITVPPLTQTNSVITVKGLGMQTAEEIGDFLLQIKTTLPKQLTEDQKTALLLFK